MIVEPCYVYIVAGKIILIVTVSYHEFQYAFDSGMSGNSLISLRSGGSLYTCRIKLWTVRVTRSICVFGVIYNKARPAELICSLSSLPTSLQIPLPLWLFYSNFD